MSQIIRRHYRTWDEYKSSIILDLFKDRSFNQGQYLFRGCADSAYQLTSSFDRMFATAPPGKRLEVWNTLLNVFRETCESRGVSPSILENDGRLLAFGQHHGLPTRLLDWSLSPYIAAFFAFRASLTAPHADDVAIWVLDTTSGIWSAEYGVEVVAPPAIENVRLLNQNGRFTYSRTPYATLEEYVERAEVGDSPLMQFTIPTAEAASALPDLQAMGVTPIHLFPGMDGLTEAVVLSVLSDFTRANGGAGH